MPDTADPAAPPDLQTKLDGMTDEQAQARLNELNAKERASMNPADMTPEQATGRLRDLQEKQLAHYTQEAVDQENATVNTTPGQRLAQPIMERGIQNTYYYRKAISAVRDPIKDWQYGDALQRFNRLEPTEDDMRLIAKQRLAEHLDSQASTVQKIAGGPAATAWQVGLFMAGGADTRPGKCAHRRNRPARGP